MTLISRLGLQGRLLLILLAVFATLAGLAAWQSLAQRDALAEAASERLLHNARLIAARQQALVDRGDAFLNSLIASRSLRAQDARENCSSLLMERLRTEPAYFQVSKVAPNGDVLCAAVPGKADLNFGDRLWFQQALRSEGTVVSEVLVGRILGKKLIALGKAMRNEAGQVEAVFSLAIGLDWLRQELARTGLPAGARVLVIDEQGKLVLVHPGLEEWADRDIADHPLTARILAAARKGDGVIAADGLDRVPRLIAHTPLLKTDSGHQYHLWLSLPREQVEAPAQQRLYTSLAIALGILALTLGLLYWGEHRQLLAPLRALSKAVQGYRSSGRLDDDPSPVRDDEIGNISRSLEDLAGSLEASNVTGQYLLGEIEERQRMESDLRRSQLMLNQAMRIARLGARSVELKDLEDFSNNPVAWSEEMYRLLGYTPEEVPRPNPGYFLARVHPDDRLPLMGLIRRTLAEKRSWQAEYRILLPDGTERCVIEFGEFLFDEDGKPQSMHGAVQDITERKRAEAEIAELNASLEERVRQRTTELLELNKELESFSYAASHDMKAPLGRINSFAGLLGQRYGKDLEGDGLFFLDLIQQNALRLTTLIEDLLAHARIGQEAHEVQPIELKMVVEAILRERTTDIRQCGAEIRLDLPDGITVRSHPFSLSQILRNLVENALKYSDPARLPAIEIGARSQGNHCRLWVRDNGIGIAPAYQERIFEIFRRLHTYGEYPGTGVGLALVRKAVERLGGRVWVESELGQGATFYVELPS